MFTILRMRYSQWVNYKQSLRETRKWHYFCLDLLETVLVALALALVIRKFVIQTSLVPTGSMIPTLMIRDRLFVNKFIYDFRSPKRGDIVVFKSPHDDGKDYVKRCVGLPGETVEVRSGRIYVNEKELIIAGVTILFDRSQFGPVTIPPGHYFMMGDNRANSQDSRYWGTVPEKDLLGKALFTFWPLKRMRVLL